MSTITLASLNQISNYLKVPVSKLALNSEKLPTCNLNNTLLTGFVNIILTLIEQSRAPLLGSNSEEEAEVRQWLEYCMTYATYSTHSQILQELNDILATRTYFVGNSLTMADVAVYYSLQSAMERLSYLEKEQYLNLSRWYDHIQQNNDVRNNKQLIDFNTLFLTIFSMK
ncbi:aaRS-interacting multifunctional protein 3 [Carabus blaptoides fortunei]